MPHFLSFKLFKILIPSFEFPFSIRSPFLSTWMHTMHKYFFQKIFFLHV
jgi:hypothetical protein